MTGSAAPFFVTSATLAGPAADGKKRKASAVDGSLLRGSLEDLVASKREQPIPLSEVRDVLMDHVLETLETDLKYTVFLVCEEVSDLHPPQEHQAATNEGEAASIVDDNNASAAHTKDNEAQAEAIQAAGEPMAFLDGTDDWYRFRSQLSEGDSIPRCDATLLRMPVSKNDIEKEKKSAKKSLKMKIKKFKKLGGGNAKPTAEFYVLSEQELKVHVSSIPYDDNDKASDFLSTLPLPEGETRKPEQLLLALDCEMCKTTKGAELTRLTLVDANEQVLIDEYVRPKNPIVDYCTQYSGITVDIMDSTTNTLDDIQKLFLKRVPAEAILVGHSIENDLQALKILHHRIIDTTALYPHPKGLPFRSALRFLSSTYLNKAIQTGTDGHCSIEDAVATLQLVQLKIKHGPAFPSIEQEYKQKKVINELCRLKKSVLLVDTQRACRALSGGAACIIPCDTNDKIAHTVVHQLTTGFPPTFTWARMRGASRAEIAKYAQQIKSHLPEKTCFMVVIGGDSTELRELHKLRTTRADPRSTLFWDKKMQAKLDAVAAHSQQGLVHVFLNSIFSFAIDLLVVLAEPANTSPDHFQRVARFARSLLLITTRPEAKAAIVSGGFDARAREAAASFSQPQTVFLVSSQQNRAVQCIAAVLRLSLAPSIRLSTDRSLDILLQVFGGHRGDSLTNTMDPSKKDDEAAKKESGKEARKDDESKREDEDDSDNQLDDESKDEMIKRGAVGRRFAVVDLPALEQLAAGDAAK